MSNIDYKARMGTLLHIKRVNELLINAAVELMQRAQIHDASKLESPEVEIFDEHTSRLAGLTYGSPEYTQSLKDIKPALDHHYAHNKHHTEHYADGINDMDLFDVMEMLVDWKAAGERHTDGNILKSLDVNRSRYKISDQLFRILQNTAHRYLR
jgi:hypothetical protein